ncbi:MAG: aspartate aminotransferase family protein [Pseudomonadales bacterium]|nr:aspartate aminotransferase family protein [Pseudomonadales bacterium]
MSANGLMSTYAPLPVTFEKGEGIWIYDTNGEKYLDALGGIAVCGLGHCHPEVTRTISEQASRLIHTSNLYHIGHQEALSKRLTEVSGMDSCFFTNSGAEANECAIKLARLYGNNQQVEKPSIIVTDGAFHGRTMATLTATGSRKVKAGFEPLVQGFVRAPFNDIEAIETIASNNNNVVAIMVEPIQGEGGINVPEEGYLKALRKICDQNNWLLILDEIQTGNGRTGNYFAYQGEEIYPDIVTTAKGLGNGMPIGACLAKGKAAELFKPGNHGSTYGGNPLACATALTVVDTLVSDNLIQRAAALGERMLTAFNEALGEHELVDNIRGKGLMIGIELTKPCGELVGRALENKLLINVTSDKVIRLLPALIMSDEEADQVANSVIELVQQWAAEQ